MSPNANMKKAHVIVSHYPQPFRERFPSIVGTINTKPTSLHLWRINLDGELWELEAISSSAAIRQGRQLLKLKRKGLLDAP